MSELQFDDWELILALRAHANHIRNHKKSPREYYAPDIPPEMLDKAAGRLEAALSPAKVDEA